MTNDKRWWENENRKCKDDRRFTELPRGVNAKREKGELIYLCLQCPVVNQCLEEALRTNKQYSGGLKGVIQGGREW